MSEIIKLYKNAGISCKPNYVYNKAPILSGLEYPPFTAEKQIEILKLILKKRRILDVGYIIEEEKYHCMHYKCAFNSFKEALCADVNYHWQDLTPAEKQQVKRILE